MKKIQVKIIVLMIISVFLSIAPIQKAHAQVSVNFQFFYDELSPYRSWVSYPQYGYVGFHQ
ncbi:hypothetical protein BH11BAC1_BH11BAC1_15990 [soil metagenome]